MYCGVAGYASKDATAVCSVPGGAVVMIEYAEFAPCGVESRMAGRYEAVCREYRW